MYLRLIVKDYLNRKTISDSVFFKINIMQGPHWVYYFIRRHQLMKRVFDNVKVKKTFIAKHAITKHLFS